MASFIKKIFGTSSKEYNVKKETTLPKSESQESIQYWEKVIKDTIPNPQHVINRGIIESAFKGIPVHQRILGLAFLLFSKDHAQTWLRKAAEHNDSYSKEVLEELAKENSDKYLMIWWSTKDFTQQPGYPPINVLHRAKDMNLNRVLFRNAIIVPFLDDVIKKDYSFDYFEYIRDCIDAEIIPNSEVICFALEDTGGSENCTPVYKLIWLSRSFESLSPEVVVTRSFDQPDDSKYEKEYCFVQENRLFPELSQADYFNLIQSRIDPNIIPDIVIKVKKYKYYGV